MRRWGPRNLLRFLRPLLGGHWLLRWLLRPLLLRLLRLLSLLGLLRLLRLGCAGAARPLKTTATRLLRIPEGLIIVIVGITGSISHG